MDTDADHDEKRMPTERAALILLDAVLVTSGSIGACSTWTTCDTVCNGGSTEPAHTTTAADPPSDVSACTVAGTQTTLREWPMQDTDPTAAPPTIVAITKVNGI